MVIAERPIIKEFTKPEPFKQNVKFAEKRPTPEMKVAVVSMVTADTIANKTNFYLTPEQVIEDLQNIMADTPDYLSEKQMKLAQRIVSSGEVGVTIISSNRYNRAARRCALEILQHADRVEKQKADRKYMSGEINKAAYVAALRPNIDHQLSIIAELNPIKFDNIARSVSHRSRRR